MEQFVKSSVEVIVTFMKKVYSHSCKECTRWTSDKERNGSML